MKPFFFSISTALGFGILFLFFDFLFNGLGFSWLSDHWNQYNGSMSWPAYRVTLRPQGMTPAPTPYFPNLRYGFTLTDHAQLNAKLLQSEIPVADIGPLLYDTTCFSQFSPDSLYYAWVGLRGNSFSFALGARPAFVVLHYRAAAAATATVPSYPVQHNWRSRWQLYAWASFSMGNHFRPRYGQPQHHVGSSRHSDTGGGATLPATAGRRHCLRKLVRLPHLRRVVHQQTYLGARNTRHLRGILFQLQSRT